MTGSGNRLAAGAKSAAANEPGKARQNSVAQSQYKLLFGYDPAPLVAGMRLSQPETGTFVKMAGRVETGEGPEINPGKAPAPGRKPEPCSANAGRHRYAAAPD